MSYRSDRFNRRMRHELYPDSVSDLGLGVERMLDAIDYDPKAEAKEIAAEARERDQLLKNAIVALIAAGLGHTVPTLLLIIENINNREDSICEMANS